jgi:TatD DNase family protein
MIDVHCHLEQPDFNNDRKEVIMRCKKELKSIITCCTCPKDFNLTLKMTEEYKDFIYCTIGLHPIYINKINEVQKDLFLEKIKSNKDRIIGFGEIGLDYDIIKDDDKKKKQKDLFKELISFSKSLGLPLIIHSRNSSSDAIKILENFNAKNVLMHMFGDHKQINKIIKNDWFISINGILMKSKQHKKIIRDMPLERILTETDSPWLNLKKERNTPLTIRIIIEKIASIKKISWVEVDEITTNNAEKFFNLISNKS